ncbi:alpha/beta fold hydrolase [Curtobacterium sp. MCBD17_028]|uniref:alpha/beta fold hydrolase n=1 Tax=Curtobacterium sp. MCBD17_028 TaxID=2175670 RepID=UPI000DA809F9|nr:alpha/beta fold hydrolase [Curtobacterium sp. MCBD17_028]PZE30183.1 enterotoxin [Curtobacterium sp. MCBD17_028]
MSTRTVLHPVDPDVLRDLRERVRARRVLPAVDRAGQDLGMAGRDLDALLDHWADAYRWEDHEARVLARPWMRSGSATPVNAIVHRAGADAPVVLFLHGWPDSVLRFERVLDRVDDVTCVVPALPGFPFAAATERSGWSAIEMADAVHAAMLDLGFDRFVVSAGDVGCDVGEAIAARHPGAVAALHLTDVSQYHFLGGLPDDLDDDERAYVERGRQWQRDEGGYMHEQSTRPNTLSVGLADSPAGLAAWIGEKLDRWTDQAVDTPPFSRDELLTWITAYWVSGCIGTSFAPYAVSGGKDWGRIDVPTVMTVFPADLVNAPRRFAERRFRIVDWREFEHGGHFAAWERPDDYLWGVRRAVEVGW